MKAFGSFETARELARAGGCVVYVGKDPAVDTAKDTVLKTTDEELAGVLSPEERARREADLLRAARQQRELVASGAQRWAKVYYENQTDEGAYYVADYYKRSLDKLIATGVRLDSRALRHVIASVIEGLLELRRLGGGRAHANLKPANVLIGGEPNTAIEASPVMLSDPAPAATAAAAKDDVRAVGRLIYELVMLRPPRDQLGLTVTMSAEWSRLGAAAPLWVDLCNRLIDSAPGRPLPDLEELPELLPKAVGAGPKTGPLAIAAVAGIAVLAGVIYFATRSGGGRAGSGGSGGGGGTITISEAVTSGFEPYVNDYLYWFGPLREKAAASPEFLKDYPALRDALTKPGVTPPHAIAGLGDDKADAIDEIKRHSPASWTSAESTVSAAEAASRSKAAEASYAIVHAAREALLKELGLATLAAAAGEWRSLGWTPLADFAQRQVIDPVAGLDKPGGYTQSPKAIEDALPVASRLSAIGPAWAEVEKTAASPFFKSDEVLKGFAVAAAASVAQVVQNQSGLAAVDAAINRLSKLKRDADAVDEIAALDAKGEWAGELFRAGPRYAELLAQARAKPNDPAFAVSWTSAARAADWRTLPAADDPRQGRLADLRARITETRHDIAKAAEDLGPNFDPKDKAALEATLDDAGKSLDDVEKVRVVAVANEPALRAAMDAVKGKVDEARRRIPSAAASVEALIADLRKRQYTSRPLADAWAEVVKSVQGMNVLREANARAKAAGDVFDFVQERFAGAPASAPGVAPAALARVVQVRRDAAIQKLVPLLTAAAPPSRNDPTILAALKTYTDWVAAADAAIQSLGRANELLAQGFRGSERGPDGRSVADLTAAARDAALGIAEPVAPMLARLTALEALAASSDAGALVQRIERAGAGELAEVLTAWERLPKIPWPTDGPGLVLAAELLGRVRQLIDDDVKDRARHDALLTGVNSVAKDAWRSFYAAAEADEDFGLAFGSMGALGVTTDDLATIGSAALFNSARHQLLRASQAWAAQERTDPAQQAALINAEVAKLGEFIQARNLAGDERFAKLLADLEASAKPPDKPLFDPNLAGPARAGWRLKEATNDAARLVYTNGSRELEFLRVDPAGGEPAYVSTGEVSVGLVIDVVGSAGKWSEFNTGDPRPLPLYFMGATDRDTKRPGPRVWVQPRQGDATIIVAGSGEDVQPNPAAPDDDRRSVGKGWFALSTRVPMADRLNYLADAGTPGPTPDSPMQYIAPDGAALVAAMVGCRLPSANEWLAAKSMGGGPAPNLRDSAWKQQFDHAIKLSANAELPLGRLFWPRGAKPISPRSDGATRDGGSDGVVFFRPVQSNNNGRFADLIGNVAEFVIVDGPAFKPISDATIQAVRSAAPYRDNNSIAESVRVVGGSALTPPADGDGKPIDIETPARAAGANANAAGRTLRSGYSDVGFRLAFGTGGAGAVEPPLRVAARVIQQSPWAPTK